MLCVMLWIELTFAETCGIVTRDVKKIDHLHDGVIFTTTGSISFFLSYFNFITPERFT